MTRRLRFISALSETFPGVLENPRRDLHDLIHLEVAEFRDTVETAVREGRYWYVEKAFWLIEQFLDDSDDDVDNALGVSFIEDFALSGFTDGEVREIVNRLSKGMRRRIAVHGEQWHFRVAT